MKRIRLSLPLGALVLLVVLSLLTGCYKAAAPDVEDTPVGQAQVDQPEEGTPDMVATAMAESTRVAEASEPTPGAEEPEAEPTSTPEPPTATPPPPPTNTPPVAAATFTPSPSSPTATPAPVDAGQHTVQAGENLFRIALRYNTTVDAIADANGIANPALVYVGQVLTIPGAGSQPTSTGATGGTTYVVQPGDNLFRIALRYNLGYLYLAQYNGIANPASIYVGQVLRIP